MPSDAKFGLAVGVTLVIAVAVLFYRKEPTNAAPPAAPASAVTPVPAIPPAPAVKRSFPANSRPAIAQTLIHTRDLEGNDR